jgi:hypothetical protein
MTGSFRPELLGLKQTLRSLPGAGSRRRYQIKPLLAKDLPHMYMA